MTTYLGVLRARMAVFTDGPVGQALVSGTRAGVRVVARWGVGVAAARGLRAIARSGAAGRVVARAAPTGVVTGCLADVVVDVAFELPALWQGRTDACTLLRKAAAALLAAVVGAAAGAAVGALLASTPAVVQAALVAFVSAAVGLATQRLLTG